MCVAPVAASLRSHLSEERQRIVEYLEWEASRYGNMSQALLYQIAEYIKDKEDERYQVYRSGSV